MFAADVALVWSCLVDDRAGRRSAKVRTLLERAHGMNEPLSIVVTREVPATLEVVFDAWFDSRNAGRWLFATSDGVMEAVEIDPRVGGRFRIAERRGAQLAEHVGTYVEVDRPR